MSREKPTREQAIKAAGQTLAASRAACAQMTPREQAEAAWTPTSPYSVDELEQQIRAQRSITPHARSA
ncbi:hypothetical protein [Nocardioides pakistanensis]